MSSSITFGYVWQILRRRSVCPPTICVQPQKDTFWIRLKQKSVEIFPFYTLITYKITNNFQFHNQQVKNNFCDKEFFTSKIRQSLNFLINLYVMKDQFKNHFELTRFFIIKELVNSLSYPYWFITSTYFRISKFTQIKHCTFICNHYNEINYALKMGLNSF